jgi:hypothetical protein
MSYLRDILAGPGPARKPNIVTAADYDLDDAAVRRLAPGAVEYVGLCGEACWSGDEVEMWAGPPAGGAR